MHAGEATSTNLKKEERSMERYQRGRATRMGLATIGALFLVSACSHVSQDEFERELDQVQADMRQELHEETQALEQRLSSDISQLEARLTTLEGDLEQLRQDFDVTIERLESAIRFNAPVHFAFDDDAIRAQDRELLERFAQVARTHYEGATITVEGFTDPAGSAEYNRRLGERRAESVREYLVAQGLSSDQLRTVSYGEDPDRQVIQGAQGPGEEGWQNRRVAMVIDFRPDTDRPQVASSGDEEEGH